MGKIQEKRNQNNQNVHWIFVEARDDGRNINIVIRGGAKIGTDEEKQDPMQHQWVKKNIEPKKYFDARREKETFKEDRQDFLKKNLVSTSTTQQTQNSPLYKIPSSMNHNN